jgi:protein-S-isoprenylcysteine O-methyltransferase
MGLGMILRHRRRHAGDVRRGRGWTWGFVLQGLSIAIVWFWRRPAAGLLVSLFAVMLAAGSVAVMISAQRALGRQFAYQARLIEGHRLVTSGPYRWVRHPIYFGLFGLVLGTGLVLSRWPAIPFFAILYAAGTVMRIRAEERLLHDEFGAEFEAYSRRVRAFFPWPHRVTR